MFQKVKDRFIRTTVLYPDGAEFLYYAKLNQKDSDAGNIS